MPNTVAALGSPSYHLALDAARAAAGAQHYPAGALYVVATPIGNLADVTLRALHVLAIADAIACEDTRRTQQLLRSYRLDGRPLIALHEHNEAEAAQGLIARLQAGERQTAVDALAQEPRAVVLLEAPHRIAALGDALARLGERPVTVGRELTKQFEQIATLPCAELPAWLAADAQRQRGEFALVLHPAPGADDSAESERVLRLLLAELPTKSAVKLAADITGAPRNALYERALALKSADQ